MTTASSSASSEAAQRRAVAEMLGQSLRDGEPVRLAISGQCMEPLLLDGDEIEVAPRSDEPHIGDIWLAHGKGHELVCHRVVGRRGDDFLLVGDRTLHLDSHPPSSLLGRVVAVHRAGRTLRLRFGAWDRLQARLHLATWRRRESLRLRLVWHWPRRMIQEIHARRWYFAKRSPSP